MRFELAVRAGRFGARWVARELAWAALNADKQGEYQADEELAMSRGGPNRRGLTKAYSMASWAVSRQRAGTIARSEGSHSGAGTVMRGGGRGSAQHVGGEGLWCKLGVKIELVDKHSAAKHGGALDPPAGCDLGPGLRCEHLPPSDPVRQRHQHRPCRLTPLHPPHHPPAESCHRLLRRFLARAPLLARLTADEPATKGRGTSTSKVNWYKQSSQPTFRSEPGTGETCHASGLARPVRRC